MTTAELAAPAGNANRFDLNDAAPTFVTPVSFPHAATFGG
jgi:hypothetical protein